MRAGSYCFLKVFVLFAVLLILYFFFVRSKTFPAFLLINKKISVTIAKIIMKWIARPVRGSAEVP